VIHSKTSTLSKCSKTVDVTTDDPRWNLNIHYQRAVLEALPAGARTALDVGCGDGLLTFDLADRGLEVTGLDVDEASIHRARSDQRAGDKTHFLVGDFFSTPLESFPAHASETCCRIAT
jgi:2-polyprenyl-3-methyl-5-hydroxy-6-metoxy-1,4-benzoquinol methylase